MPRFAGASAKGPEANPCDPLRQARRRGGSSPALRSRGRLAGLDAGLDGNCGRHRLAGHRGDGLGGASRVRLLLDTHIWLWSLGEPVRLGARVRRELRDRTYEVWLSSESTWEALLLSAKGRIRIHGDVPGWLARATAHLHEAPQPMR